jgi:hypothetical protein
MNGMHGLAKKERHDQVALLGFTFHLNSMLHINVPGAYLPIAENVSGCVELTHRHGH